MAEGLGVGGSSRKVEGPGSFAGRKGMVAWLVRAKTGVSIDWVPKRLEMGHPSSVSRAVRVVEISRDPKMRALEAVK